MSEKEEVQEVIFDPATYTVEGTDTDQYELVFVKEHWRRKRIKTQEVTDG